MKTTGVPRVDKERALLLLIDAQTSFFKTMAGSRAAMLERLGRLAALGSLFDLPTVATLEKPVAAKGRLPAGLRAALPETAAFHEKVFFDCFANPALAAAVRRTGRRQLIIAGSETDVCVLQTVLGALAAGYEAFVVEDCLFSASPDCEAALRRMRRAGAVGLTYKTLFYELQRAIHEELPAAQRRARRRLGRRLFVP